MNDDRTTDAPTAPGALAGIRVIDLTTARSGPTCTRQLADLGADVIRVCDPARGDLGGSDAANLQRNKRSIALDLRQPAGLDVLLRLVDTADVFVENMRPGAKHRLGIGPERLLARNPRLVYASLSGFGQTGPYAERPGVDQIAQGMSGLMSVTGPPGSGPWRAGIAVTDTASGTFLTQGVLAALFARERTGAGQWVHTSLLESAINLMDFQACRWLTDGVVPQQEGNDHPTFFPMGTYTAADGHLNIAGMKSIDAFLGAIDALDLLDDDRFADAASRREHREAFNAACNARLGRGPVAQWVERLNAAGIPAGPVYALDETFADPQVQHLAPALRVPPAAAHPAPTHRDANVQSEPTPAVSVSTAGTDRDSNVQSEPTSSMSVSTAGTVGERGAGEVVVLRYPVTLTGTPATIRRGPPAAGLDTRAVLADLGVAPTDVEALLASGAAADDVDGPAWLT